VVGPPRNVSGTRKDNALVQSTICRTPRVQRRLETKSGRRRGRVAAKRDLPSSDRQLKSNLGLLSAEAQRLARRRIVGEDDYQQVAKLIEAVAERISIQGA
jgi:hypothetical protein